MTTIRDHVKPRATWPARQAMAYRMRRDGRGGAARARRGWAAALAAVLLLVVAPAPHAGVATASGSLAGTGTWTPTGSMTSARSQQTATLLPNGKVLVAGGCSDDICSRILSSAELYNPGTGTWSSTGAMRTVRTYHTATLLPDGKVLVAGGSLDNTRAISSAELYDPKSATWVATGAMREPRYLHTATLLPSGKVLVAGGENCHVVPPIGTFCRSISSAELYDPKTGTWAATGPMLSSRFSHTATLLSNGTVLVAGGDSFDGLGRCSLGVDCTLASAEIYNPATGVWTPTGAMHTARQDHTATLLTGGDVLVTGGCIWGSFSCGPSTTGAELYNPRNGRWSATGSMSTGRSAHTATLLHSGLVLVAGGCATLVSGCNSGSVASAELYNPSAATWSSAGAMSTARYWHTATLLSGGRVLVAGGSACTSLGCPSLAGAEVYTP